MKNNKFVIILFCVVFIIFISLWLVNSGIFFQDEVSSRAKKVFAPQRISVVSYE
ncbi:hypothetical protein [Halanaerobacter jeridensis]|uniref:Ion transporter superfamily protein YfcC n=1 Tax=Halanaerobacter jeridensis TaxID=706427 RepID=A0A938XNC6_9FIRM|nr:hypothetical protein [Halanaerobacter jeridensis]MBM7555267.1 putative ion transporter superfamily protein YfcC [Halanaerobacter jeridensis]